MILITGVHPGTVFSQVSQTRYPPDPSKPAPYWSQTKIFIFGQTLTEKCRSTKKLGLCLENLLQLSLLNHHPQIIAAVFRLIGNAAEHDNHLFIKENIKNAFPALQGINGPRQRT